VGSLLQSRQALQQAPDVTYRKERCKLFFRVYGSTQLASCTAVTIGNNAIWTAGHCVSDGAGHWHNSWVFVPAYRDGEAPFGQWPAFFARTFQDWYYSSNSARDSGGLVLRTQNGVTIGSKLGYLGFSWNQYPVNIHWHAIGYPGEIAYGLRQIHRYGLKRLQTA
jgi:V8-like Glu-specific endopeptidase